MFEVAYTTPEEKGVIDVAIYNVANVGKSALRFWVTEQLDMTQSPDDLRSSNEK